MTIDTERLKTDAPEWDGEGLPPVNVKCEMADENGIFREVLTFAVFNAYVFGWDYARGVPYYSDDDREFRPLRTKEQRERDELVTMIKSGGMPHWQASDAADAILAKYNLEPKS